MTNTGASGTVAKPVKDNNQDKSKDKHKDQAMDKTNSKDKGKHNVNLSWSGSSATNVDVWRNGAKIATTANDGAYHDNIGAKGGATYNYQVCDAGTSNCSNTDTVVF